MSKNSALPAMTVTLLLDFIGLFMVIPIFAPLLLDPHSPMLPTQAPIGLRTTLIGLLIASYGFGQLWGGPVLGELSDQLGRKKVIIWGVACLVGANILGVLSLFMNNLVLLFLCRFGTGFASGNGSVIFAAVTHSNRDEKQRGLQLGYLAGACSIGAVLGPVVGAGLSAIHGLPWPSKATPFLFMSIAFAVNIFMLIRGYQDRGHYERRPFNLFTGFKNIFECFTIQPLPLLLLSYFLFVLSTETIFAGLPIFAVRKFQVSSAWLGVLFAMGSLCSALSSLVINRKLSEHYSSNQIVLLCLSILCIAFFLFLLPRHPGGLFIPYALVGFTCVLVWAHYNSIFGGVVAKNIQGKVIGVAQSLLSLSILIGPPIMGGLMAVHQEIVVYISGCSSISALVCFSIWVKQQQRSL
ncbi:MAG TPA: MFS transporter [Gammaproteobacteria bacterium]|nr:MFS transporter [Gammaproteobacteria bacterium]